MRSRSVVTPRLLRLLLTLATVLAVCWLAWRQGVDDLRRQSATRAAALAAELNATLDRYSFLPWLLARHPFSERALGQGASAADLAQANAYLESLAGRAHVLAAYLVALDGHCLAASNYRGPVSFVGQSFLYRPYFRDALAGRHGRFFGVGTTSREAGYYLSEPVSIDGRIVGVAVVKIDLDWLQQDDGSGPLAVVDRNGVIVLSTVAAWRYASIAPLSASVAEAIASTRQYAERPVVPLALRQRATLPDGGQIVSMGEGPRAADYLSFTRPLDPPGWRLRTITPLGPARWRAAVAAFVAACATLTIVFLGLYWRQRRARIRAMAASRLRLKAAYDEMEARVTLRTAELSAANARLRTEIADRVRTEEELREAHADLLRASRLAALGQISAGLTHELNQPLTALRSFSDNTLELFERGRLDAARENLHAIAGLAERMGKITNTLKVFVARGRAPSGEPGEAADVLLALREALRVLAPRWQDGRIALTLAVGETGGAGLEAILARAANFERLREALPLARCDALRLEQILINLLGNACDALQAVVPSAPPSVPRAAGSGRIAVHVQAVAHRLRILVEDDGPGVPDSARGHVFEPFFSTKPVGAGMGLGLAIVQALAADCEGNIALADGTLGGAAFALDLPAA